MFINNKVYKVKDMTDGIKSLFNLFVETELNKIYNPLNEFIKGLNCNEKDRAIIIQAFIANKRDKEYPDYLKLVIENSLGACKLLADNLMELDFEVTEDNKYQILKGIWLHNHEPEREQIQEIKGIQKCQKE